MANLCGAKGGCSIQLRFCYNRFDSVHIYPVRASKFPCHDGCKTLTLLPHHHRLRGMMCFCTRRYQISMDKRAPVCAPCPTSLEPPKVISEASRADLRLITMGQTHHESIKSAKKGTLCLGFARLNRRRALKWVHDKSTLNLKTATFKLPRTCYSIKLYTPVLVLYMLKASRVGTKGK